MLLWPTVSTLSNVTNKNKDNGNIDKNTSLRAYCEVFLFPLTGEEIEA